MTNSAKVHASVLLVALGLLSSLLVPAAPAMAADFPIDPSQLRPVPEMTWGVSGQDPASTQTPTIENLVWDFQQIGDRMFVGGAFLNVQQTATSSPIAQRSLAAFDVASGEWISTWTPQFDRAVYSLGVSPSGTLLVGGEFEEVNGQPRSGLVALDPLTGEIDSRFEGSVQRPWSTLRAQVRQIRVVGQQIYVAGNFSRMLGKDGTEIRAFRAGRFLGASGVIDEAWRPEVTGSGVWGMAVDRARGQVHLTGYFSAVNGEPGTGNFHTVDDQTGASVQGLVPLARNMPSIQPEMYDVAVGDDLVFVAGEQHVLQVLNPAQQMIGFHHTGLLGDRFEVLNADEIFAGGAYQVAEQLGDVVFAGCHCTFSTRDGVLSHYSSFTGARTPHRLVMAYDASTGQLIEDFRPDIFSPQDGVWALGADSNGCLYVGGDLHVGGLENLQNRWLGGFAKLCGGQVGPTCSIPTPDAGFQAAVAADATSAQVWRLYSAFFLRQPDRSGFDYWIRVRRSGYDHDAVAGDFERSTEFQNRYGTLTDYEFLLRVYQNVLCRSPDVAGLSYWLEQLDTGLTRGQLVLWFTEGIEYLARTGTSLPITG